MTKYTPGYPFDKIDAPKPHPARREEALHLAMQAFDTHHEKKISKGTQGSMPPLRLSDQYGWQAAMIEWMKGITSMERKHWMASVSVAAIAAITVPSVLLLNHQHSKDTVITSAAGSANIPESSEGYRRIEAQKQTTTASKDDAGQGAQLKNTPLNEGMIEAETLTLGKAAPAPASGPTSPPVAIEQKAERRAMMDKHIAQTNQPAAPAMQALMSANVVMMPAKESDAIIAPGYQDVGRDQFSHHIENPIKQVAEAPVSTFSIDVDTASYSFMRRQIMQGVLPARDSVRIEEMVNYFPYDYQAPDDNERPFASTISVYPSPWNPANKLIHIGIKGKEATQKKRTNLVFLLDVSGSMNSPDKLPLLQNALRLLVGQLGDDDRVGIVVYAGAAGVVLDPTSDRQKILTALDQLSAGGSTAGGEGIRKAYDLARAHFDKDAVNRVILATDGDFNVGITNPDELQGFISRERESGVFLSVLGFGAGNYNDALMQKLAQNGNGVAAYIDTLNEARKVLVEEASASLYPIAKDVKIQVEFNPEQVASYRLIGYESRMLNREDFNNDKVDAGEIGAGHSVTALYEIAPVGAAPSVDPLRYQTAPKAETKTATGNSEYAFLKIRYKLPNGETSKLIERPIGKSDTKSDITQTSPDMRFAAAVAGFGQLLQGSAHIGNFTFDDVAKLAEQGRGTDPFGYRTEFLNLVRLAKQAALLPSQR